MSDNVLKLDHSDFKQHVLQSDRPVLVDFWADWCQPCHMLAPTVDKIAEQYGDRVTVAKVDIDANSELAGKYSIQSIPTVLIFEKGEVKDRIIGVQAPEKYETPLEAILN